MTKQETISAYNIWWACFDCEKIYKYQEKELRKLGFSVCRGGRYGAWASRHCGSKEALMSDLERVKTAYNIILNQKPNGCFITDRQVSMLAENKRYSSLATTAQKALYNEIFNK